MGKNIALQWREALLNVLEPYPEDTPILLSGGMDSNTVLAGLLALGRRPKIYHFYLGNIESPDMKISKSIVKRFNLDIEYINIPRTFEVLINDVESVLKSIKVTTKTLV